MATITITVEGQTIGTVSIVEEVSGTDSDRLLAYLVATHGKDTLGNQRTGAEMVAAYWEPIRRNMLDAATRFHQDQAAAAARQAVAPIASITSINNP